MGINVSLTLRVLVNNEALNMAESVGNVTRHRRAPIVVASERGYSIVYAPAVSGESLAYHYQKTLTQVAQSMNLPTTKMDRAGYYVKFSDDEIIKSLYDEVKDVTSKTNPCEVETTLLNASVVADVTGFLYTNKLVKRISRIKFSYMIPTLDALESGATATYPQLHVRYVPPELFLEKAKKQEEKAKGQALYYVEGGSSLYMLTVDLDVSSIGIAEYCEESKVPKDLVSQRSQRIEVALKALAAMFDGMIFGAKRSRYNPIWSVKSLLVSVSKGPVSFEVSPAVNKEYVKETYSRAVNLMKIIPDVKIKMYVFNGEGLEVPEDVNLIEQVKTHTEALEKAINIVKSYIGNAPKSG